LAAGVAIIEVWWRWHCPARL